jgi:hypothetical protein
MAEGHPGHHHCPHTALASPLLTREPSFHSRRSSSTGRHSCTQTPHDKGRIDQSCERRSWAHRAQDLPHSRPQGDAQPKPRGPLSSRAPGVGAGGEVSVEPRVRHDEISGAIRRGRTPRNFQRDFLRKPKQMKNRPRFTNGGRSRRSLRQRFQLQDAYRLNASVEAKTTSPCLFQTASCLRRRNNRHAGTITDSVGCQHRSDPTISRPKIVATELSRIFVQVCATFSETLRLSGGQHDLTLLSPLLSPSSRFAALATRGWETHTVSWNGSGIS